MVIVKIEEGDAACRKQINHNFLNQTQTAFLSINIARKENS
jgi:hypothetical protein